MNFNPIRKRDTSDSKRIWFRGRVEVSVLQRLRFPTQGEVGACGYELGSV